MPRGPFIKDVHNQKGRGITISTKIANGQDFGSTKVILRYETLHIFKRGVLKRVKTCYVLYGWSQTLKDLTPII